MSSTAIEQRVALLDEISVLFRARDVLQAVVDRTRHTFPEEPGILCRTIGMALQVLNDGTSQAGRERVVAWVSRHREELAATAYDGCGEARGYAATDHAVRRVLPWWVELAGVSELAASLRALPTWAWRKGPLVRRSCLRRSRWRW